MYVRERNIQMAFSCLSLVNVQKKKEWRRKAQTSKNQSIVLVKYFITPKGARLWVKFESGIWQYVLQLCFS